MRIVYGADHVLRAPVAELSGGLLVPPFESPQRASLILEAVTTAGFGPIEAPAPFGLDPVLRVHDAAFVAFLESAHARWRAAGFAGDAIATAFPARRMRQRPVRHIEGQLGYYCHAAETAICAGTWAAAQVAKDVALTAARLVAEGAPAAFALGRPPGHHAATDLFGGYCFLNNAAIAAQWLRDQGAARIAILDVDFHHGNGTQDVFWQRNDVLVLSLHGDPEDAFPHFSGFADEVGAGPGDGFNGNYPLPPGTGWPLWSAALHHALSRLDVFAPDVVVVSLGLDGYVDDPLGFFTLTHDDFQLLGRLLARTGRRTLYVLEGGYAIDDLGANVVAVLAAHAEG